jgi:RNA polymerase sigma factor for flagellar operon FliA
MFSNLAVDQTTAAHTDPRSQVVLTHLKLIRTIAKRLSKRLPPSVEVEELVNIGVLGLLDAWDRFDASKGVPFKSYAELRIKGQMIDALRSDDLVPRSVRRKHTRLQQERTQLTHRLGRTPTRSEMSDQLDLAPVAYDAYVTDSRIAKLTSLDAPVGDDSGSTTLGDNLCLDDSTAEDSLFDKQMRESVASAVHHLPERERKVVTMYYIQRCTLREIGAELGVTESRACQLRGQGVKRLRFRLRGLRG